MKFRLFILVFVFYGGTFKSQLDTSARFHVELTSGYSHLLGSSKTYFHLSKSPDVREYYSGFFITSLNTYINLRKRSKTDKYGYSIGLGYSQWIYTVTHIYKDWRRSDKWGFNEVICSSESNVFTALRSQVSFFVLRNSLSRKSLRVNYKLGVGCLFPTQTAYSQFNYTESGYDSTPIINGNTPTSYKNEITAQDSYTDNFAISLSINTPIKYNIHKNLVFLIEPGITLSGWKYDYGIGAFCNLNLGIQYSF